VADLPRTPGRFGSGQAAVFSGISTNESKRIYGI
jgi:hypothetical protein